MLDATLEISIPDDVLMFDARWLNSVLPLQYPGVVVTEATTTKIMRTACTKIFLTLRYNQAGHDAGLPEHCVIKTGLEPHSRDMYKMLLVEAHAYAEMLPRTPINRPQVYFSGSQAGRNHVLLMEDLSKRNVRFLDMLQPLSYTQMEGFLDLLATLHARWWEAPEVSDPRSFEWMPEPCTGRYLKKMDLLFEPDTFATFLAAPRGAATPISTHDSSRLRAAMEPLRALHLSVPRTVCHGDTHINNLYEDADGTPALLDWSPRKAPWFHDVAYVITAGLDVADRRAWERALLSFYLGKLRDLGAQAPSFDFAWSCYRREIVWGMFIFLTNGFVFQTESSNTAAAARFGAAMLDHDTFRLLGV